jgi:sporulation protein YlmC with PRC-barrel domain
MSKTMIAPGPRNASVARPVMLSASTLTGNDVCNKKDERLGTVEDIMLDIDSGTIRYAVMSSGGFLGMGDRLFAVPWGALKLDSHNKRFILDVDAERVKAAPGFDKDHWPDMADKAWATDLHAYYGTHHELPPN